MKNALIAMLCFFSIITKADNIQRWLQIEGIKIVKPILTNEKDVKNTSFNDNKLVLYNSHNIANFNPSSNKNLLLQKALPIWKEISIKDSIVSIDKTKKNKEISYFASYVNVDAYTKAKLSVKLFVPAEIFVDGKLMDSNYNDTKKDGVTKDISLSLLNGKHCIIIKTLSNGGEQFQADIVKENNFDNSNIILSTSPKRGMCIGDVIDGVKLSSVSLAPEGQFILVHYNRFTKKDGKNESWSEVIRVRDNKMVYSFRNSKAYGIKWMPYTNNLSWMISNADGKTIYKYDIINNSITPIIENIQNIESYSWANDLSYIIYTYSEDYSEKNWDLRKLNGIEDRKPYFRSRTSLYKYDIATQQTSLLNWGNKSLSLHDISHDSKKIIVANSYPSYTDYPYSKQNIYIVNIETMSVDTLWKDRNYDIYCQFSPNDKQLLVQGGGKAFGDKGLNIKEGQMANNYDSQLYIYDINSKHVEAITREFNPNIESAEWFKNGNILILAEDKDYKSGFQYNVKTKIFKKIDTRGEYIKSISFCDEGLVSSYVSCSANSPYKAYFVDLRNGKDKLVSDAEADTYKNVEVGDVKEWNFKMENGDEINGRYYLPANFDANKKYPLLVYYYGGTSPVGRYFGGRYPFNLFAANGYVVYVLQPSGATGFGQEFAARHQNNWCKITADEIITGVKKFSTEHSFINKDKIACMGASYGGFTTEFLQTQTDIFACAISHAGISSISSYWGEGYWGYQYSTEATGKSFPWNRKDIYVNQSSLFNADKIKTPMLLLHGTADVNVPTGESIQLYTALKLLGNDVELVLINGSDHIVYDYKQRIKWNNTIISYLDKYLKNQPQWWNDLYPDKNL